MCLGVFASTLASAHKIVEIGLIWPPTENDANNVIDGLKDAMAYHNSPGVSLIYYCRRPDAHCL